MRNARASGKQVASLRVLAVCLLGAGLLLAGALGLASRDPRAKPAAARLEKPESLATPRPLAAADVDRVHATAELAEAVAPMSGVAQSTLAAAPDASGCPLAAGGSAVSGTVVDATGGVIAGASVRVAAASPALGAPALTDSDGHFLLCAAPGFIDLQAEAPEYTRADARVRAPARGLRLRLVPASSIVGRVVQHPTGEVVAGAVVSARDRAFAELPAHTATTDAAGRFELTGIATGTYELVAVTPNGRGRQRSLWVNVSERVETTIRLHPATRLSARIELDERPCPAGVVELSGPVTIRERTGPDGTLLVDGLLPGQYLASFACSRAEQPTPEVQSLPEAWAEPMVGSHEPVNIAAEPVTRVWRLRSDPAEAQRGPRPSGSLRVSFSGADESRSGANAIVVHEITSRRSRGRWQDGRLVFEELELGRYDVYLEQCPEVRSQVSLETSGQVVEAALELPRAASIAGRVLDERGQPLPDTWVRAYNSEYPFSELGPAGEPELTDVDGAFLLRGLFAKTYRLVAIGAVGIAETEGITGGSREVVLQLASSQAQPALATGAREGAGLR